MRLVWVQQWAVLPVIVEDRDMVEDNGHGQSGRLPPGGQAMDPSARARLSDREGPLPPRTSDSYTLSFPICLHLFTFSICSSILSQQQQMPPMAISHMTFSCKGPVPSSKFPVATRSTCPDNNRAQATNWGEDSLRALSACLAWSQRCKTTNILRLRRCRILINNNS